MARFRVLHGQHEDKNGFYNRGDVFDSEQDLVKMFNGPMNTMMKFELVPDGTPLRGDYIKAQAAKARKAAEEAGEDADAEEVPTGAPSIPSVPTVQQAVELNRAGTEAVQRAQTAGNTEERNRKIAEFEKATVEDLREYAEANEVDLKGKTLKRDIIEAIVDHELA